MKTYGEIRKLKEEYMKGMEPFLHGKGKIYRTLSRVGRRHKLLKVPVIILLAVLSFIFNGILHIFLCFRGVLTNGIAPDTHFRNF